jgi:hypothetical protein
MSTFLVRMEVPEDWLRCWKASYTDTTSPDVTVFIFAFAIIRRLFRVCRGTTTCGWTLNMALLASFLLLSNSIEETHASHPCLSSFLLYETRDVLDIYFDWCCLARSSGCGRNDRRGFNCLGWATSRKVDVPIHRRSFCQFRTLPLRIIMRAIGWNQTFHFARVFGGAHHYWGRVSCPWKNLFWTIKGTYYTWYLKYIKVSIFNSTKVSDFLPGLPLFFLSLANRELWQ